MRSTRTVLALGAICALGACTTTTDAAVVPTTTEAFKVDRDLDIDEDATADEIALEITWATLPADDKTTMCEAYNMLTEDQFRRMAAAYADELDPDAFIALLDKEC